MRSRSGEWDTKVNRKRGLFGNRPKEHPDIKRFGWVSDKVEEILKRNRGDNNLRNNLHAEIGEEIGLEELEGYLAGAKKGTAPGVSGIGIELWHYAPDEAKEALLDILNTALLTGAVPEGWLKRAIRPLAKTETAVGLNDIRPITLLEVSQKILTGILTARIAAVWNMGSLLNDTQMAFLEGRGCYQALERLRSIMYDSDRRGKECHMLFLDLAKAYDSVELINFHS